MSRTFFYKCRIVKKYNVQIAEIKKSPDKKQLFVFYPDPVIHKINFCFTKAPADVFLSTSMEPATALSAVLTKISQDISSDSQPCQDAPMEDPHQYVRNDHMQKSVCRSDGEDQAF